MENSGNGHKSIEEMAKDNIVKIKLGELMRQDGIIAESIDKNQMHNRGVLQTLITAVDDDKDYRQILKLGRWKNDTQRDKDIKAIAVCRITGAKNALRTILDKITAQSAGIEAELQAEVIKGITHTTFTSESILAKKQNKGGSNGSRSPIGN